MRRAALRTLLLILLALAVVSPVVQAGTPSRPEVEDERRDATPDVAALDLRAMWVSATEQNVSVILELEGLPQADDTAPCAQGSCQGIVVAYRAFFRALRPDGTVAPLAAAYDQTVVEFRHGWGDGATSATIGYLTTDGAVAGVAPVAAAVAGTQVNLTFPRSNELVNVPDGPTPGAFRLNATYAVSQVLRCTPGAGDVKAGCAVVSQPGGGPVGDRAPDTGPGLDFVFASPPGPPANVTFVTVTATATVTATDTRTATVSQMSHNVSVLSFTGTPFPRSLSREGLPGPGVGLLAVLALGAVAVRRAL